MPIIPKGEPNKGEIEKKNLPPRPINGKPKSRLHIIAERFDGVKKCGCGWKALCPAHDDTNPSLSISEGKDGKVLIYCHRGCPLKDILEMVGLSLANLFPNNPMIVATYDYRDKQGELRYQVCRMHPKSFRQRSPDVNGGWIWKLDDVKKVLYRLPELCTADPAKPVYIVEGEKDADRLASMGFVATTNCGGAGKWKPEYAGELRGKQVIILGDNDDAGRNHAEQVARSLQGMAASVKVVELPGLPAKGDVSDWLDGGGTSMQLHLFAKQTPPYTPNAQQNNASKQPSYHYPTRTQQENTKAFDGNPRKSERKSTFRKSQVDSISPDLQAIKALFKTHYYFSDEDVIDLILGIVAGNHIDSDPIWLHLIAPPSGGKTELLFSTFDCPETYFLSDFTAAALISGYKDPPKEDVPDDGTDEETHANGIECEPDSDAGGMGVAGEQRSQQGVLDKDYSLLPKLNGKVVITKDFSIIHDKPSEARAQILAILRDVYDGYASRALGNSAPKGFHSRFNYITGMTPDIEKSWSLNTLGERFLMYRIRIADRREHAKRALLNARDADNGAMAIRKELQEAVSAFMAGVERTKPKVADDMLEKILDLADILSTCRTYVHRDRNDDMPCLPQAELASRVGKQLMRVGQSVASVRRKPAVSDDEFKIMKRIALDSLPTNRRHLLFVLWKNHKQPQPLDVFTGEITRIAKTSVARELENLTELGAVVREKKQVAGASDKKTKEGKPKGFMTVKTYYQLSQGFIESCKKIGGIPSP